MDYQGKPLKDYHLWDLGKILQSLDDALAKREEAAKHPKFTTGVEKKGKKLVMDFPPPNPAFIALKEAIELEIHNRNHPKLRNVDNE